MALTGARLTRAVQYNKSRGFTRTRLQRLQRKLGVTPDGDMGPQTTRAVYAFQSQRAELSNDGKIGPMTLNALDTFAGEGRGLSGAQVAAAVRYNRGRGYPAALVKAIQRKVGVDATGVWDDATISAIYNWQGQFGLVRDGKVGPGTISVMNLNVEGAPKSPEEKKPTPNKEEPEKLPQGNITTNFTWHEFRSRGDNKPVPAELRPHIREVCQNLEVIRAACGGRSMTVNSGYRSPWWNAKVGGKKNSYHKRAMAADIRIAGMSPRQVKAKIESLIKAGKVKQGGIGLYSSFVHYDIRGFAARW